MKHTNYSINKLNYALIPFQYYMKSFDDSLDMWMHRHEYFEIMYVNSGNIVIKVSPDENLKDAEVYNLTQGQFIFLKPNLYHQMIINKNETAFVYNVEFLPVDNNNEIIKNAQSIITVDFEKLFFDTKLNNFMKSEAGFIITTDTAQVGTTIKELIFAANQKKNTKEDYLSIILREMNLLIEISNCIVNKKLGEISYIRKANSYIMDNYNKKITIDEIAEYVNISKSYLEHQYKKQMGQTILGFINVLRVQKASKLLLKTSMKISEIATQVGYQDKNQLNYEFKKIIGMTPREYRKNNEPKIDYTNEKWFSVAIAPENK